MPADDNTIHPLQIGFPEADLTELRNRINAPGGPNARQSPTTPKACAWR